MWHPVLKDNILTSSIDGTVRLWDANDLRKQKVPCCSVYRVLINLKAVIKAKNARGLRAAVHYASYSHDGNIVAAGKGYIL